MNDTLYRKIGRRYVAVNDPWAYEGLRQGHWHVWVRPGSVTIREFVFPNKHATSAAIEEVREAMMEAMQEANKSRPVAPLTDKEKKAVKAYREVMGEDAPMTFTGISMWALVDAGIKVLINNLGE